MKGMGVVADHMERPEHEPRTADMTGHASVKSTGEIGNARDVILDIIGIQRFTVDIVQDHDTRLGMNKSRREAGFGRRPTGHHLPVAKNVMKREILTEAHDIRLAAVIDLEALIAEPPLQRFDLGIAMPDRQRLDPRKSLGHRLRLPVAASASFYRHHHLHALSQSRDCAGSTQASTS